MKFTSIFFPASESIFDCPEVKNLGNFHVDVTEILRRYAPLNDRTEKLEDVC